MTYVLCWDIDGTLLTTARAGVGAWERAVARVLGDPVDLSGWRTAGLSDGELAMQLTHRVLGHLDRARALALLAEYERRLPEALHRRRGQVLAGVEPILDDLRSRGDVVSLVLTGNTPRGARAKLTHYGLNGYFTGGAYCRGLQSRTAIGVAALDVCTALLGRRPPLDRLFVVGDTPADVACGAAIGARTVAVASGEYDSGALAAAGPSILLHALPAPDDYRARLGLR